MQPGPHFDQQALDMIGGRHFRDRTHSASRFS
jgi:hypothetical protein